MSTDSSTDGAGNSYKAAEYFRIHGHLPPSAKLKEAQAEALRADPVPQYIEPRKERPPPPAQIQTPTSAAQLLQLLGTDAQAGDTRQLLRAALAQLDAAEGRAPAPVTTTSITHAMQTLQAASVAQKSAAAAQAEVSLQKMHLEAAQAEIARAQDVVRALEAQRDDAERAAAKARGLARRLQGEKLAVLAREEGRREGYETGFGHGRVIAKAKSDERQKRLEAEMRRQLLRLQQQQAAIAVQSSAQQRESEPPATRATGPPSQPQSRPPSHHRQSVVSTRNIQPPPPSDEEPELTTRPRATSAASSQRVSAPPAPRSEVRDSGVVVDPVPIESVSQEQNDRTSSASGHSLSHSTSNRHSTPADPPPQPQPQRRDSVASRASRATSASHNIPATTASANRPPSTTSIPAASFRRSFASSTSSTQVNNRARNAAALISAMMPQQISIPPPRINVEDPSAAFAMPTQHIPMPPPPWQEPPPQQQPLSMPIPAPAPAPIPFEVERVTQQQPQTVPPGRTGAQTPSSVSTSLRTLRLTSFPPTAVAAGSEPGSAMAGPGMGMGGGLRERELSVILEHAEGSPGESVLGNPNPSPSPNAWASGSARYSDPRGMEEWRRGTDEEAPRNTLPPPSPLMAPAAGLLSPFDVRPVPGGSTAQMHPQRSRESIRSTTSKSSDTVHITIVPPSRPTSIGLPPGPGYSHDPPSQGPRGSNFLSPNDAPDAHVVPEEEDDDDDDDESDGSSHGTPGFVRAMGPLPAFAQGVTYPPGFVPMSVAPPPQPLPPATQPPPTWAAPAPGGHTNEDGPQGGLPLGFQPTTPRAPSRSIGQPDAPPLGFHQPAASGFQRDPPRPVSRQGLDRPPPQGAYQPFGGFQREPATPASRQGLGRQPPVDGAAPLGFQPTTTSPHPGYQPFTGGFQRDPPRPASRQGHEGQPAPPPSRPASRGGSTLSIDGQPLLGFQPTSGGFQPPTRPASRQMNEAPTWGVPSFSDQPPRLPNQPLGEAPGVTTTSSWGAAVVPNFSDQPPRPASRQMGANPSYASNVPEALPIPPPQTRPAASTWTAPPVIGANSMGPSNDPSWTFGGAYNFGQAATPRTQPAAAPLGFSVEHVSRSVSMTHSPQLSRPQSLAGPPVPEPVSTYFAPTPGRAAGLPLPPSVSASSSATTNTTTPSGQRIASYNAGTTPAAFHARSLSGAGEYRAPSRASSHATSRGSTFSRNQTPNPNANLGITNPYTSIREGDIHSSGSSGSSSSSLGLAQTTAHNTYANANVYYGGGAVIPPSPAHSYRPM